MNEAQQPTPPADPASDITLVRQLGYFAWGLGLVPLLGAVLAGVAALVAGKHEALRSWRWRYGILALFDLVVWPMFIAVLAATGRFDALADLTDDPDGGRDAAPAVEVHSVIGVHVDRATGGPGVEITKVIHDSPAAVAGLEAGERILTLDDVAITSFEDLVRELQVAEPGVARQLTISRADAQLRIEVTPVHPDELVRAAPGPVRELRLLDLLRTFVSSSYGVCWALFFGLLVALAVLARRSSRPAMSAVRWTAIIVGGSLVVTYASWGCVVACARLDGQLVRLGVQYTDQVLVLAAALVAVRRLRTQPIRRAAVAGTVSWWRGVGLGLVLFVGGMTRYGMLRACVQYLSGAPDTYFHSPELVPVGLNPWWMVPAAVLLAPITEELTFRGVLFPGLRAWLRREHAYLLSAGLFAILHVPEHGIDALGIVWIGVVLAWARDRTGGLAAPIVIHFLINSTFVVRQLLWE